MKKANLEDIIGAIFEDEHVNIVGTYLFAHLMMESLLDDCIDLAIAQSKLKKKRRTFHNKVRALEGIEFEYQEDKEVIIDSHMANGLRQFNQLRNKLAHEYRHEIEYEDIQKVANSIPADYTDEAFEGKEYAEKHQYSLSLLIVEMAKHVFFEVAYKLNEMGGAKRLP